MKVKKKNNSISKSSSLGRPTKNATRLKEIRSKEDENSYSQTMEKEKHRRTIEKENESSEHHDKRMALHYHKKKLMSQAILKEHKQASPALTRGALKRKCGQQNYPSSKRTKMVGTKFFVFPFFFIKNMKERNHL